MKKFGKIFAVVALLGILAGIVCAGAANAQLIRLNIKCKIVKVDQPNNRLEIRVHEGDNKNVQYVLFDDKTRFSTGGKELTYKQAWNSFEEGMVIRVKGGYTVDMKIKARKVYW